MLFKFNKPQKLKFWGYNTYIPLDIAFISEEGNITKISDIAPLSTTVVSSDDDCNAAIEANINFFENNKIKVGDKVKIDKLEDGTNIVFFV